MSSINLSSAISSRPRIPMNPQVRFGVMGIINPGLANAGGESSSTQAKPWMWNPIAPVLILLCIGIAAFATHRETQQKQMLATQVDGLPADCQGLTLGAMPLIPQLKQLGAADTLAQLATNLAKACGKK